MNGAPLWWVVFCVAAPAAIVIEAVVIAVGHGACPRAAGGIP